MWALGCILYKMIAGAPLFPDLYAAYQYIQAQEGKARDEIELPYSAEDVGSKWLLEFFFANGLLSFKPEDRPSAKSLKLHYHYSTFIHSYQTIQWTFDTLGSSTQNTLEIALAVAAENGRLDVVRELLNMNVDARAATVIGETPLKRAFKHSQAAVSEALIRAGAESKTLVMDSIKTRDLEGLQFLMDAGADARAEDESGHTALRVAISQGLHQFAELLLRFGADGRPILMEASVLGNTALAKMLINEHVNCNISNNRGDTPLHIAAYCDYYDLVCVLLDAGADQTLVNKLGLTASHMAALNGRARVLKRLINCHESIDLRKFYDPQWTSRYLKAWSGINNEAATLAYAIPSPLKRYLGRGWFAIFNQSQTIPTDIRLLQTFRNTVKINDIAFSGDGTYIAVSECSSLSQNIEVFNILSGKKAAVVREAFPVSCFCFSPNGMQLAIGNKNLISVWSVN